MATSATGCMGRGLSERGFRGAAWHGGMWGIGWCILAAAVGLGLSVWAGWRAGLIGDGEIRLRLGALAATAAAGIDPLDVTAIQQQGADSAARQRVVAFLDRVKATNPECRFVYLLVREEGRIVFLAENQSPEQSGFREVYEDASDAMLSVFVAGRPVVEGPLTDRWGEWVSGLAPVKSASGSVVALVGVDLSAVRWNRMIWFPRVAAFAIVWLSSMVVGGALVGLLRNRRTRKVLRYRDALLRAVTEATDMILTPESPDGAINGALGIVGGAAGADRLQLFEVRGSGDAAAAWCRYEWCAPGVAARIGDREMQGRRVGSELLSRIAAVGADARHGSCLALGGDGGAGEFALEGEWPAAVLPVCAGGRLWGCLVVFSGGASRGWSQGETPLLMTLASVLGDGIKRAGIDEALRELALCAPGGGDPNAFFGPMVRHLAAGLGVRAALVAEIEGGRARALALAAGGELRAPFAYDLEGTPCGKVIRDGFLAVQSGVRREFPGDPKLEELAAESYCGVALRSAGGEALGLVCAIDSAPIRDMRVVRALVDVFGGRAAAEIERSRSQRELSEARDRAVEASRAKSSFLASMSHEIRTPMNAIIGMTELLLDGDLAPAQREHAIEVQRSACALLEIINEILDFSKIEAGRVELEERMFDLPECIREVLRVTEAAAGAKRIELACELSPTCPRLVVGDAGRLRQILLNLVNNAVKFTPAGRVVVGAGLAAGESAEARPGARVRVELRVRDTGIGIAADLLEWIFDPFTQVDASSTRRSWGTGLGLSICRRLVNLMGGAIRAESAVGCGSVFTVTVPLALGDGSVAAAAGADPERRSATIGHVGRTLGRVLVIEDNAVNRHLAALQLERLGVGADTAVDGLEGIEMWERGRHGVVFLDCQMPGIDGYETAARLREAERRAGFGRVTRIIALTAHALAGERERCIKAGMDDYVTKPATLASLADALGRAHAAAPAADYLDAALIAEICGCDPNAAPDAVREILAELVREVGSALELWLDPAKRPQGVALAKEAHSLKGSSSCVGFRAMAEVFSRIEKAAKEDAGNIDALVASAPAVWKASLAAWGRAYPGFSVPE